MRRPLLVLLLGVTLALATTGCGGSRRVSTTGYLGGHPGTAYALPAVSLTDSDGRPATLAPDGRATLLYFGYTGCPDVCPTTMADIATALRAVTPALRAKVRVVMVTSDPIRDTPPVLKTWLGAYDPTFTGLTGEWPAITAAAKAVGVLLPDAAPATLADVGHSAQLVGFTPAGQGVALWLASADGKPVLARQLEHDLPLLVAGRST